MNLKNKGINLSILLKYNCFKIRRYLKKTIFKLLITTECYLENNKRKCLDHIVDRNKRRSLA